MNRSFLFVGSVMVALTVLKILGYCTMSWWLVLMPFYILPVSVVTLVLGLWAIVFVAWLFIQPFRLFRGG